MVLPTKYNLYKIYELQGKNSLASEFKTDITTNYPDSRYAAILNNPNAALAEDDSSPESVYNRLYREMDNQNFQAVVDGSDKYITVFQGDPMLPKFELLKATATGRLHGYEAYEKALNYVAYNYANTPEGAQAQDVLTNLFPKISSKEFVDNPEETNFKVVYYFKDAPKETIEEFSKKLQEETDKVRVFELSISKDLYDSNTTFVVLHGLTSKEGAAGYADALEEKKKNKIKHQHFAISSTNYKTIQIHKNMDAYLASNK